jgi:L-seryl-tRNA(Ser) seleniumtransferase
VTRRDLPAVEHLLQLNSAGELTARFGRPLLTQAIREALADARKQVEAGADVPGQDTLIASARSLLEAWLAPTLRPVINATGVILHTNLGRAPLSEAAREAIQEIAASYSNLEYDVARGRRGKRDEHAEEIITRLTGAEAAMVVNNNASALLLALTALARRKEVIISRSQLIEIGGGFRIPDVMKQSGAKLVEVGTTNRTHLLDFEAAIHDRTGLILRAHHSNFKILGFTTEPALSDLVQLGDRFEVPVLDDLGSGALIDTATYGLGHEPMVQESIRVGASLVAFSGDKLIGGPQAGILAGRRDLIQKLKKHALARAVRPDKLCLAGLTATLKSFLTGAAEEEIPIWQMISASEADLKTRAETWKARLGQGETRPGCSTIGGGSLPEETLPTWTLALTVDRPNVFAGRLRSESPPIITRVEDDLVHLDPRTVLKEQEEALLHILRKHLG